MDNRPIGVFDSGFGGLTAVKALREQMPEENIIYFGDSGRAPYGERPVEQLRKMAQQDIALLLSMDVKAILAACGTVSSTASELLMNCPVPVVGVLQPAVLELADQADAGPLGILATPASIRSGAFHRLIAGRCPERKLLDVACPDFVTLIESGHYEPGDPLVQEAVARYLQPVKEAEASAVLLGCTHFGLIAEAIRDYLGDVELVSAAECAARLMKRNLEHARRCGGQGLECYYTSGDAEAFRQMAAVFLGREEAPPVCRLPRMEV